MKKKETSKKVQLRSYLPKDYASIRQNLVEGELFDEDRHTEKRLRKRVEEKPDSIIVATINNVAVGSVFIVDDFYPYVFGLTVQKAYRGRGIGEQLVNEAIIRMRQHGHIEIEIMVEEENAELKGWYRKQRFKQSGVYRCMWRRINL